jgi:hypothetical protein
MTTRMTIDPVTFKTVPYRRTRPDNSGWEPAEATIPVVRGKRCPHCHTLSLVAYGHDRSCGGQLRYRCLICLKTTVNPVVGIPS